MDASRGGTRFRARFALIASLIGAAALPASGDDTAEPPLVDWAAEGRAAVERAVALTGSHARAKNVILFVGDGMGISTVTAARILEGQLRGEPGEENLLSFEHFPFVALSKTYNTNQQTPDSAGTMTAMVTGSKTRAGVLSVDQTVLRGDFDAARTHPLETIVEQAETRGLSTGLVTTTTVTHATPAALYAHVPERTWASDSRMPEDALAAGFPDIALQLIEFSRGDGMEVVLGGGERSFRPTSASQFGGRNDSRDLIQEWLDKRPNSVFVRSCAELSGVDPGQTDHLLGLFAPGHLQFEADRAAQPRCEPSLSRMTEAALSILERNDKGFFLMVEGGRIDHAHHGSNAYRALHDAIEFSHAVDTARKRTSASDTLIVVTADHGHVMMIAGYPTRGNDILGLTVENDDKGNPGDLALDANGLPYTTLGYLNGPGYVATPVEQQPASTAYTTEAPKIGRDDDGVGRIDLRNVDTTAPNYIQESAVPIAYETHSGEDVAIYADGPGAVLFHGVQEQNYIYHVMVEALGWNDPPPGPTAEPTPAE